MGGWGGGRQIEDLGWAGNIRYNTPCLSQNIPAQNCPLLISEKKSKYAKNNTTNVPIFFERGDAVKVARKNSSKVMAKSSESL